MTALYWYAFWYAATEACVWALEVIEREPPPHPALGAHATAALGAWRRGEHHHARAIAARDRTRRRRPAQRFAWEALSSTAVVQGDYAEALACHATARDLALRAGDITQAARETAARALTLGYLKRVDDAQTELEEARMLAGRAANPTIDAFCDYVTGELQLESAPRDALPRLSRARDSARTRQPLPRRDRWHLSRQLRAGSANRPTQWPTTRNCSTTSTAPGPSPSNGPSSAR